MNEMTDIKKKIHELHELIQTVPQNCKGESEEAKVNRRIYMKLRSHISDLVSIIN